MSVYKDNKRSTYYVSYSYKDETTGKFKHVTKRGFKTKKEAQQWERENYGSYVTNGLTTTATFTDVAREYERANQSSNDAKRIHRENEEKRFSKFSNRPIKSITKVDLIKWQGDLAETSYSTRTKNRTISFVKAVFAFAHDIYGIEDVAHGLKCLRMTNSEVTKEMEVWTPEEFQTFLEVVDVRAYRLFYEFLFWTGCRRGEAMALQKADVANGWATIRYSQRNAKEGLKPTKTRNIRRIKIDDTTWNDIKPLLHEHPESEYFFTNQFGRSLSQNLIRYYFEKGIRDSGVKKIRIHDLRHSHATWLINNGVNIVAVSKRLGHATIQQTLKTYTHLLAETDQEMMGKINEFRGSSGEIKCGTNLSKNDINLTGTDPAQNAHFMPKINKNRQQSTPTI